MLSQAVKNTNITINLNAKPPDQEDQEPKDEHSVPEEPTPQPPQESPQPPQESALVLVHQLISDLESVFATLKKINKSLVGNEHTEVFLIFMLNFDKILNLVKKLVKKV